MSRPSSPLLGSSVVLFPMDVDTSERSAGLPQYPSSPVICTPTTSSSSDTGKKVPQPSSSNPPIRSRITVVCAECKRLKLKCDRGNPCSSCTKRDTVDKCIYSTAAAEKVDIHSLNNRLVQVERALTHYTNGAFVSSYPYSQPPASPTAQVTASPPSLPNRLGFHTQATWSEAAFDTASANMQPYPTFDPVVLDFPISQICEMWVWPDDVAEAFQEPSLGLYNVPASNAVVIKRELSPGPNSGHSNPLCDALPPVGAYYLSQPTRHQHNMPTIPLHLIAPLPSHAFPLSDVLETVSYSFLGLTQSDYYSSRLATYITQVAGLEVSSVGSQESPFHPPAISSALSGVFLTPADKAHTASLAQMPMPQFSVLCALAALAPTQTYNSPSTSYWCALSAQLTDIWEMSPSLSPEDDENYLVAFLLRILLLIRENCVSEAGDVINRVVALYRSRRLPTGAANSTSMPPTPRSDWLCDVWWDVVLWDAFVSTKLQQPPLIPELSVPPIEDNAGSKVDVFGCRCRLAVLLRKAQSKMWNLSTLEKEADKLVTALRGLRDGSDTDDDKSWSPQHKASRSGVHRSHPSDQSSDQRCTEMTIMVYQLLISSYLPSLLQDSRHASSSWIAVLNAAHCLVRQAQDLNYVHGAPASIDHRLSLVAKLFPVSETLFACALISGYASITQGDCVWAPGAAGTVEDILDFVSKRLAIPATRYNLLRLVQQEIDTSIRRRAGSSSKRKFQPMFVDNELPSSAPPSRDTSRDARARRDHLSASLAQPEAPPRFSKALIDSVKGKASMRLPPSTAKSTSPEHSRMKDREKKGRGGKRYPSVGIRIRRNKDAAATTQKAEPLAPQQLVSDPRVVPNYNQPLTNTVTANESSQSFSSRPGQPRSDLPPPTSDHVVFGYGELGDCSAPGGSHVHHSGNDPCRETVLSQEIVHALNQHDGGASLPGDPSMYSVPSPQQPYQASMQQYSYRPPSDFPLPAVETNNHRGSVSFAGDAATPMSSVSYDFLSAETPQSAVSPYSEMPGPPPSSTSSSPYPNGGHGRGGNQHVSPVDGVPNGGFSITTFGPLMQYESPAPEPLGSRPCAYPDTAPPPVSKPNGPPTLPSYDFQTNRRLGPPPHIPSPADPLDNAHPRAISGAQPPVAWSSQSQGSPQTMHASEVRRSEHMYWQQSPQHLDQYPQY